LELDWREGAFSDWQCLLDTKAYKVHRLVLGSGSRCSQFFRAAFNETYEASSTDITALIPRPCHGCFELALDFMYGRDVEVKPESCLPLYKIADALQIDTLLALARSRMQAVHVDREALQLAFEIELPRDALTPLVEWASIADLLAVAAVNPTGPGMKDILEFCACKAKGLEHNCRHFESLGLGLQLVEERRGATDARSLVDANGSLHLKSLKHQKVVFIGAPWRARISTCVVRIDKVGEGSAVGVARQDTKLDFSNSNASTWRVPGCWALDLSQGAMIAEGVEKGTVGQNSDFFIGKVLTMVLDVLCGVLHFNYQETRLGTIEACFEANWPLHFVAASSAGADIQVLDWQARCATILKDSTSCSGV